MNSPDRQIGATLLVALVVLLMMSTIGITVANLTTVDLKITANMQAGQHAYEGAESGILLIQSSPARKKAKMVEATNQAAGAENAVDTMPLANNLWQSDVRVKPAGTPVPCPALPAELAGAGVCIYYEVEAKGEAKSNRAAQATHAMGSFLKVADQDGQSAGAVWVAQ